MEENKDDLIARLLAEYLKGPEGALLGPEGAIVVKQFAAFCQKRMGELQVRGLAYADDGMALETSEGAIPLATKKKAEPPKVSPPVMEYIGTTRRRPTETKERGFREISDRQPGSTLSKD